MNQPLIIAVLSETHSMRFQTEYTPIHGAKAHKEWLSECRNTISSKILCHVSCVIYIDMSPSNLN